jgi:molybdenum-dependent DNA-binding transcriptional regulator ModE
MKGRVVTKNSSGQDNSNVNVTENRKLEELMGDPKLRSIIAVAETGSFTEAAKRLRVSKSLISKHVKSVERLLNKPLFIRTTRSVKLTCLGKRMVTLINSHLSNTQSLIREALQQEVVEEAAPWVKKLAETASWRSMKRVVAQNIASQMAQSVPNQKTVIGLCDLLVAENYVSPDELGLLIADVVGKEAVTNFGYSEVLQNEVRYALSLWSDEARVKLMCLLIAQLFSD